MTTAQQQPGVPEGAPALTPEEQAAVDVGRRGFSEPENVLTPAPSVRQRPEGVPEKFWNAETGQVNTEALLKSYTELERARTPTDPAPEQTPVTPAADPTVGPDGKITKAAAPETPQENPLTSLISAAQQEYSTAREVTEETIAGLEAAGVPREVFALYLKGVEASERATIETVHGIVGGAESYTEMSKWAATALSDAELEAFNAALDNEALRENAVRGLHARFKEARPSEGNLIAPNGASTANGGDVYTSRDQLIADQKDPRYQTDGAFRQSVQDKLLRSQQAGFKMVARPMFERQVISS